MMTVGLVLTSTVTMANPYAHTHYHINKLEKKMNNAFHASELDAEAGASTGVALSSIPHATGVNGALGVAVGKYGSGRALAVGYGVSKGNLNYKFGVSMDNRDELGIGAGLSYNF